jgi:hypothetical protein
LPRPTPTVIIRPNLPTATPVPARNPLINVSPGSGQPGTGITINGSDFAPGSPVGAVSFGGVSALPAPPVTVDSLGSFYATVVVPEVSAGNYNLTMTVGADSASTSFTVSAAPVASTAPQVPAGSPIIAALEPLVGNLQWVAYFDNATKSWSLYDPTGTFDPSQLPRFLGPSSDLGDYTPLTSLSTDQRYHWFLQRAITVNIAGKEYKFEEKYNLR